MAAEEKDEVMSSDEKSTEVEKTEAVEADENTEAVEAEEATASKNIVTIEEAGPCKKKIIVEIPAESISEAIDKQYNELRKDAIVPGFRKGRAPRRLLEKRFGKETSEQVKLKLLIDASDSAIKENKLDTLGEPDVDFEKIELPEEGPLTFEFEVEVRPEFDLPGLEGIAVKRTKLEVTDDQIDREIEQLQKLSGMWTPRDEKEGAELEDRVVADVVIKVEGKVEEENKAEDKAEAKANDKAGKDKGEEEAVEAQEPMREKFDDTDIYVRHNGFVASIPVENLDELLIGVKAGETKTTAVEVPKTFFKEEYRGRKVDVEMEIKDIKWLKPADLDKNMFERIGVESEEELRERMRDRLSGQIERQSRSEMAEQIYKYLLDSTDFDMPLSVVADQASTVLQRQFSNLIMRGLSREQIEEQMEQLRASSEEQAKDQLKTFFIMDKVAEQLGIEVSDEEINGHIAQLAIQQGQRPERMREQMERNESLGQFRLEVRTDKCVAKLLESAEIKEVEPEKKAVKEPKAKKQANKKETKTKKKQAKKGTTASKKKTDD